MDEEQTVTQEQPVQEQEQVQAVDHSASLAAIQAYQEWLSNQPRQIGPFGVFWNAEEGQSLVKQYCEEQGW